MYKPVTTIAREDHHRAFFHVLLAICCLLFLAIFFGFNFLWSDKHHSLGGFQFAGIINFLAAGWLSFSCFFQARKYSKLLYAYKKLYKTASQKDEYIISPWFRSLPDLWKNGWKGK